MARLIVLLEGERVRETHWDGFEGDVRPVEKFTAATPSELAQHTAPFTESPKGEAGVTPPRWLDTV